MNLFQLPLLSEGRCVICPMMVWLAKEQDHRIRMSTPIAYTTMTIDEALGYNTAVNMAGQGILDGWLGISGYRGGATPFFNNSSIQAWHYNAFKAIYDGNDGTYDQNWIIGVYTID